MNNFVKISMCGLFLFVSCSPVQAVQENGFLKKSSAWILKYRTPLAGALIATGIAASYQWPWLNPVVMTVGTGITASGLMYVATEKRLLNERVGNEFNEAMNRPGDQGGMRGLADVTVGPVVDALGRSLTKNLVNPLWSKITSPKTIAGATAFVGLCFVMRYGWGRVEAFLHQPQLSYSVKKAPLRGSGGTLRRKMIFDPDTRDRLNTTLGTTLAVKTSIQEGSDSAVFDPLLLYGPAGSGKGMFAEELAYYARMDFYRVPWSSFSKLKAGEVDQAIEKFFSKDIVSSPNGAIVFIDNAQMLFSDRHTYERASAQMSQVMNALVEYTERRSNQYMIVFGVPIKPTKSPDRILVVDNEVEIPLPALPERKKLLELYRDEYFKPDLTGEVKTLLLREILNSTMIELIANRLNRASPAELAAFMKTLKIESELPTSGGLSKELIEAILRRSEKRFEDLIETTMKHPETQFNDQSVGG